LANLTKEGNQMADQLLIKTAKAVYRSDTAPSKGDWGSLPEAEKRRYETMAAAALSIALREPLSDFDLNMPIPDFVPEETVKDKIS
jgi:hypothetical protein